MRRKAEILSYAANKTNSKTNNYTKAEKWSQIVNGTFVTNTGANGALNSLNCADTNMFPTPTSASGIPGPIMYLVRDLTVPLYNYVSDPNAYSVSVAESTDKWNLITQNDLFIQTNTATKLFSIYVLDKIDKHYYNYTYTTPFAIYVSGVNKTTQNLVLDVSFNMPAISSTVYFSETAVMNQAIAVTPASIRFDYKIQRSTANFEMHLYYGTLTLSNILLNTEPGFVYDIYLTANIDDPVISQPNYGLLFNTVKNGIVCNVSSKNAGQSTNITGLPAGSTSYSSYSLIGV
jgi:hypothetical protein